MSLVSHLLKRLVITKLGVPWSRSTVSRDEKGKPCFKAEGDDRHVAIDFNVSHQAGLVSLIASIGLTGAQVGTDIVCVNERLQQDVSHIREKGFADWVDMHADVLADSEVACVKSAPREDQPPVRGDTLEKQLRRFYAVWCLREAYVKMTGHALLAPWLKKLEILDVQPPAAKEGLAAESLEEGEVVQRFAHRFQGKTVTDVKTELSALGTHYMIAGSIRVPPDVDGAQVALGKWQQLDLKRDILDVAEVSA